MTVYLCYCCFHSDLNDWVIYLHNYLLYPLTFRPAVIEYGLWDQLRVDHGKEFILPMLIHAREE